MMEAVDRPNISFEDACSLMTRLRPGDKLRHASGNRYEVRGYLSEDRVIIARRWFPHKQYHHYEVIEPEAFMVGLYRSEKRK